MTNIIIDLLSHDLSLYHQADGIIVNSREFSTCNGFVVTKEATYQSKQPNQSPGQICHSMH